MINQAYEQRNSNDFEENTRIIEKALKEIERNKELKPTIAQLARMTGIHRNTLSRRMFPIQRLNKIKEDREIEKEAIQTENGPGKINTTKQLKEKVSDLQIEAIYWFNLYQDLKLSYEHMQNQLIKIKKSQEYYKNLRESNSQSHVTNEKQSQNKESSLESFCDQSTKLKH